MRCYWLVIFSGVGVLGSSYMDCGDGVELCGVLTLESGLGSGYYGHDEPCVHGLWPENGSYGTSDCDAPDDTSDPSSVYTCYQDSADDDEDIVSFEVHEWEKHGECAGVQDQDDYFTQVCAMATEPVAIMSSIRTSGGDIYEMQSAVEDAGYEVFSVDTENAQLLLSACAKDGQWTLAAQDDFITLCGSSALSSPTQRTNKEAASSYLRHN